MMRILFVCMGNICRSPSAEGVLRRMAMEQAPELELEIDSAGTHDYHLDHAPDRRAVEAARRRGIDLSSLRARLVQAQDFERFDLILAMDHDNYARLHDQAPARYRPRIRLFMEFAPEAEMREVPDPYYGDDKRFEEVLDLLETAAAGLLRELQQQSTRR